MMASGGIVNFTVRDDAALFYLPPHKHEALKGKVFGAAYIPLTSSPHTKLLHCFSVNGPNGKIFYMMHSCNP